MRIKEKILNVLKVVMYISIFVSIFIQIINSCLVNWNEEVALFPSENQILVSLDPGGNLKKLYEELEDYADTNEDIIQVYVDNSNQVEYESGFNETIITNGNNVTFLVRLLTKEYLPVCTIENNSKEPGIVLPRYYTPGAVSRYGDKSYIDTQEYIGKEIVYKVYKYEQEGSSFYPTDEYKTMTFRVIGTCDEEFTNHGRIALFNEPAMKEIFEYQYSDYSDDYEVGHLDGNINNIVWLALKDNKNADQIAYELNNKYMENETIAVQYNSHYNIDKYISTLSKVIYTFLIISILLFALIVIFTVKLKDKSKRISSFLLRFNIIATIEVVVAGILTVIMNIYDFLITDKWSLGEPQYSLYYPAYIIILLLSYTISFLLIRRSRLKEIKQRES